MYIPPDLRPVGTEFAVRHAVVDFLQRNITEEETDQWIEFLLAHANRRLPWWVPRSLVKRSLDALLPNALLDGLLHILRWRA